MGFVCPEQGKISFWPVPTLNAAVFQTLLHAFAEEQGAGRRKRVLLVLDLAGWHFELAVDVPEGVTLVPLQAYAPESSRPNTCGR